MPNSYEHRTVGNVADEGTRRYNAAVHRIAELEAAIGDTEPLEDVLREVKGQRITLYHIRHERESRWSASLMMWPGDTPEKFSVGFGATINAAIRDAVANAKGNDDHA